MATSYRIHPTIGIARVGNSEEFVLAPETMAGMPLADNESVVGGLPIRPGTESEQVTSGDLRDGMGALKRHAARFRIFQYSIDGEDSYPSGKGTEIRIGNEVAGRKVRDIIWTVHLANKKANTFVLVEDEDKDQGIKSYVPPSLPPIRNWPTMNPDAGAPQPADKIAVLNDPDRARRFTIDPGPRTISGAAQGPVRFDAQTEASCYDAAAGAVKPLPFYPKSFPADSIQGLDEPSGPIDTLGELRVDESGRLLVTGGYGRAVGWRGNGPAALLEQDVNNDRWFDDASDGPVTATIVFDDDSTATTHGAWVTATDPSFAPQILNTVSLWDDIFDAWVTQLGLAPQVFQDGYREDYKPTFDDQISPVFRAAALQQWATNLSPAGRLAHDMVGGITGDTDPSATSLAGMLPIFRDPNQDQFSNTKLMPLHLGDANQSMLALRKTQFFFLKQWDAGKFRRGSGPAMGPGELLDKSTFMNCLGGRFSPGIDVTFIVREPAVYIRDWRTSGAGPFRLLAKPLDYKTADASKPFLTCGYVPRNPQPNVEAGLEPGDLSKFMAIPWHTDYNSCATHPPSPNPKGNRTLFWSWPAQRPVAVFTASDVVQGVDRTTGDVVPVLGEQRWSLRGLGTESAQPQNQGRYQERLHFLENWYKVGTILQSAAIDQPDKPSGANDKWFLETKGLLIENQHEVVPPFPQLNEEAIDERELFYRLMSGRAPDAETLRQARKFTEDSLAWAEALSNDPKRAPLDQLYFDYTEEAFQTRMDFIYQELVEDVEINTAAEDPLFKTRHDMVIRTIQLSPFNLTDGAWIRNIGKTGPIDEVRSLLYSILMDELGDGEVSRNHCNIYLDLCHSLGFYPAPLNTREFAFDPQFLQSAFTVPAFQLAISQFSDDYYPEIIGMTLQLEWSVLDLKGTRDLLDFFGIDSHFYVMHIGIDNAVNGHGQRALDAVRIFLQNERASGGEDAIQRAWRRIWTGFVAFGNLGSFGGDLKELIQKQPTLDQRMLRLIQEKAKYGSLNHQQHVLAGTRINEWFLDPSGFLKAMVTGGLIVPGDWANSRMKSLLDFQTGPMFRVFTDDEIQLLADYTNSLGKPQQPTQPAVSPARAMAALIDQLRPVQQGVAGHAANTLMDAQGVAHSIAWWFNQPTRDFMQALILPANGVIVPGQPSASRFVTGLIAPNGPMGATFSTPAQPPNTGSCREVVVQWITAGCPIIDSAPRTLRLNALGKRRDRHPSGKILGMGTIH